MRFATAGVAALLLLALVAPTALARDAKLLSVKVSGAPCCVPKLDGIALRGSTLTVTITPDCFEYTVEIEPGEVITGTAEVYSLNATATQKSTAETSGTDTGYFPVLCNAPNPLVFEHAFKAGKAKVVVDTCMIGFSFLACSQIEVSAILMP